MDKDKSPYKFLDFYTTADSEKFFGRERETNILVADILVSRLVILFARTGTGKTSLINAGVRPILRSRGFETYYIRVEKDPTQAALAVLNGDPLLKGKITGDSLAAQLLSVVRVGKRPIVLFFDQFEEFFLQIKDHAARQNFVTEIAKTYENLSSGVHIVFSMREEYYHEMDGFRSEIPSIFHQNSNLRLLPLDEEQARDAIIKPATALGVTFDEDLAEEIIKDLKSDEEGIPAPSLQIICDTLWIKEDPNDRHLTLKDYEALGRGQGILDQRLAQDIKRALEEGRDALEKDTDADVLQFMQKLLPVLVTGRGTKIPRLVSELADKLETPLEDVQKYIAPLKGIHIIKGLTVSGEQAIEWASDYLAEQTALIQDIIESIQLEDTVEKFRNALEDKIELPLTRDDFEKISLNEIVIRKFNPSENQALFNLALFYQSHMMLWFQKASVSASLDYELLNTEIRKKETRVEVREGILSLLLELGSGQALQLLEGVVTEPAISKRAMETIIEYPGEQASQLLVRLLEKDGIWESLITTLGESGGRRAIHLLEPLFEVDTKFLQALSALESLAKSRNQVRDRALKSLENAIAKLEVLLQKKRRYFEVLDALDRLIKTSSQIQSETENRLKLLEKEKKDSQAGNVAALRERMDMSSQIKSEAEKILVKAIQKSGAFSRKEKELSLAISVLERLTQYTKPSIANPAKKMLESAIPILERRLDSESTRNSARRDLDHLAKSSSSIGNLARSVLQNSSSIPRIPDEPVAQTPADSIKTFRATRERIYATRESSSTNISLNLRFQKAQTRLPKTTSVPSNDIDELIPFISNGTVIPILSGLFPLEQIFHELAEGEGPSVVEGLIAQWAKFIKYPMPDSSNLGQVAQYYFIEQNDDPNARLGFFSFLKKFLWNMANTEVEDPALAANLTNRIDTMHFSDLVEELDYPRFPDGMADPLRLLARFPLPIYFTTDQCDFIERALQAEGKTPETQICFWSGEIPNIRKEHRTNQEFIPSVTNPLVYHLYGLEDYPQTLVLSEDDYVNFIISIAEDDNSRSPKIPRRLRDALAQSRLLLLGYQVNDWDFQILFKLLLRDRRKEYSPRSFLMQLISRPRGNEEKLKAFLTHYFDKRQFHVEWTSSEKFIQNLWDTWNQLR